MVNPALDTAPHLSRLIALQLAETPHHRKFLDRRFDGLGAEELARLDELAGQVGKLIAGQEQRYAQDYDWICALMLDEELHFRREGRYRLSSFEEAYREVYSDAPFMTHYMNGLLMSQLWWSNHTGVMDFYRSQFLTGNRDGYSHLEIGPGHGFFLALAAADPRSGAVAGWEVSEASLRMTGEALEAFGVSSLPRLEMKSFFEPQQERFDSIVFSEVLEHLDRPRDALDALRSLLAPEGRLFLNMPINSPAPDHLFNAESPEALEAYVADAGFRIIDRAFLPATNQTLDNARRRKLTISCAFIAVPA